MLRQYPFYPTNGELQMDTLVNIAGYRVAVEINGQRVAIRDGCLVPVHSHHYTCAKCQLTGEARSQAEARELAIAHGRDVHGIDVEPILTNSVCAACVAMSVN